MLGDVGAGRGNPPGYPILAAWGCHSKNAKRDGSQLASVDPTGRTLAGWTQRHLGPRKRLVTRLRSDRLGELNARENLTFQFGRLF